MIDEQSFYTKCTLCGNDSNQQYMCMNCTVQFVSDTERITRTQYVFNERSSNYKIILFIISNNNRSSTSTVATQPNTYSINNNNSTQNQSYRTRGLNFSSFLVV